MSKKAMKLAPVRFKCTVIDDEHPGGVPLERWGQQPAQFDPSAGTQVSKVWWDGDKLMTKPIPLESIYKESEQPAQQEPVAWEYGDEIFWHNAPDINDHIRSTGKPLFYLDTSQPAQQEPYCYVYTENGEDFFAPPTAYVPDEATPLYKSPPAQRKPLTDEQREQIYQEWASKPFDEASYDDLMLAVEAAHGIKKNT
jgi:hypothetical protein